MIFPARQFSPTKGLGHAPCRNTPGSPVLPESFRERRGPQARRVLGLERVVFVRAMLGCVPQGLWGVLCPFDNFYITDSFLKELLQLY